MTHMRRVRSMVCVLVAVALVITPFGAASVASEDDGRYIVIYVDGTDLKLQKLLLEDLGVEVTHVLTLIKALSIIIPLNLIGDVLQQLLTNPAVAGVYDDIAGAAAEVTPITMEDIAADPSAEGWPWGGVHIRDPYVPPGSNGTGVKVAVLDTGIDCTHPELRDNIVSYRGFSAFPGTDPCNDDNGHGTHVAGIIAARDNGHGIIGVAPEATLVTVKVLDENAHAFSSNVIAGLQYVHSKGIRAVNMSFGFYADSEPLKRAIERLYDKGVIMVASAGNCGSYGFGEEGGGDGGGGEPSSGTCDSSQLNMTYPAAYADKVIAVAATTIDDQVAYYSRTGPVDVSAPGGANASELILSTAPGGGYALKSGTSMAAAYVIGAVTLALQRKSKLSFPQVLYVLQSTVLDIPGSEEQKGAGLIDVEAMLQAPQLQ